MLLLNDREVLILLELPQERVVLAEIAVYLPVDQGDQDGLADLLDVLERFVVVIQIQQTDHVLLVRQLFFHADQCGLVVEGQAPEHVLAHELFHEIAALVELSQVLRDHAVGGASVLDVQAFPGVGLPHLGLSEAGDDLSEFLSVAGQRGESVVLPDDVAVLVHDRVGDLHLADDVGLHRVITHRELVESPLQAALRGEQLPDRDDEAHDGNDLDRDRQVKVIEKQRDAADDEDVREGDRPDGQAAVAVTSGAFGFSCGSVRHV